LEIAALTAAYGRLPSAGCPVLVDGLYQFFGCALCATR